MSLFHSIADLLDRRRRATIAVLVAVTVLLAIGLPRLGFETSQDELVNPSTQVSKDNARFQDQFGGEPMIVLITGDIDKLVAPENLTKVAALENELRGTQRFHAVIGPRMALDFAEKQLAVAPGMIGRADQREPGKGIAAKLAVEAGRLGALGSDLSFERADGGFAKFLMYEADGSIRASLRDNFPDKTHAVVMVRLNGNASIADQGRDAALVKEIVARHPIAGFDMLATGPSVLLDEINNGLQTGMTTLGGIAVLVMVVILSVVFRVRWRLLPMAVVPVGLLWAFGALGWVHIPLTMVTISGFPILLGLGVDFAIQMQNRFQQEIDTGHGAYALRRTLHAMGSPLAVAAVAAVFGFLALQLSAVPMIREFGVMLSLGSITLVIAAIAGVALALHARESSRPTTTLPTPHEGRIERVVRSMMLAFRSPRALAGLLVIVLIVVGAGLALDGTARIETEPENWVNSDSKAVAELVHLRQGTGFSSELSLLVQADDVTSTEVSAWMERYATAQVAAHPKELVRRTSVAGLVSSVTGSLPTGQDMTDLLSVAPLDVQKVFVSADHKRAALVFPIAPISLDERSAVLDEMTAALDAPAGVTVRPAGLAVMGVELVNALDANRRMMTLASLGLVLLWLAIAYRRPLRALLPLVPVLAAVGASSIAVAAMGIAFTPLTTVSNPLVIALATEFSVLVIARYIEDREEGRSPEVAVRHGCVSIGRAFVASGLTLLGGFAVLVMSPLPLLRDFGVVVSLNVFVALVAVLVLLPPLLLWFDRRGRFGEIGGPLTGDESILTLDDIAPSTGTDTAPR